MIRLSETKLEKKNVKLNTIYVLQHIWYKIVYNNPTLLKNGLYEYKKNSKNKVQNGG